MGKITQRRIPRRERKTLLEEVMNLNSGEFGQIDKREFKEREGEREREREETEREVESNK